MKKAYSKIKYIILLSVVMCLFAFNTGCGLDTFYIIEAPTSIVHQPIYNSIDASDRYFEFWTNESTEMEGFTFMGTEVYYKIYNSSSSMISDVNVLQTLSSDVDKSATAADKMINPTSSGGYGYKALKVDGNNTVPLIQPSSSNQRVYIRLSDYQAVDEYSARVLINGSYVNGSESKTVPVRNNSDRNTFNFGRTGSRDKKPNTSDEDTKISSSITDSKYYISLFAVGVGRDATYTNIYSNILYLGSITIDSAEYDN